MNKTKKIILTTGLISALPLVAFSCSPAQKAKENKDDTENKDPKKELKTDNKDKKKDSKTPKTADTKTKESGEFKADKGASTSKKTESVEGDDKNIQREIDNLTIEVTEWDGPNKPKNEVIFSRLIPTSIKFNVKGTDNAEIKNNASVLSVAIEREENGTDKSVYTGSGEIIYLFKVKGKEYTKRVAYSGFRTNPRGVDANNKIILSQPVPKSEQEKYYAGDQKYRFQKDNEKYISGLRSRQGADFRSTENLESSKLSEFNKKAEELGLDNYENQKLKGFTIPVSEEGEIKLSLNDGPEVPKAPNNTDFRGKNPDLARFQQFGIPRYLLNEKYKDYALQTYQITVTFQDPERPDNKNASRSESGTIWILDFIKEENGKYPTKWFFGTNLHVANILKYKDVKGFALTKLNPDVGIHTKLGLVEFDHEKFSRLISDMVKGNEALTTFYTAEDYLNSKPADFLEKKQAEKYKDAEEFIDFAVLELDFNKLPNNGSYGGYFDFSEADKSEVAKSFTNSYATNENKHIKFLSTSYLSNYEKANQPLVIKKGETPKAVDNFYLVGYPSAKNDFTFDQYVDEFEYQNKVRSFYLFTNGDFDLFGNISLNEINETYSIPEKVWNKGYDLSYALGYRTFVDKPGLSDEFISASKVGKDFLVSKETGKTLISSGLSYLPRAYSPLGGSSGSSMRNQNNELVAVFHASNQSAVTGLASAFRSEGFDYKGAYGEYNLPQYDLIYGGGKNQKSSYRQKLIEKYGSKHTNLFKDNYEIPEKFKFKNTENTGK
ncbi:Ig-specific serine endopeptidase MIP [Mycoplasma procyoni]|uniref:Ig-specific serine endopeptidase MIP n=1 Tax=Mycoplasma procyoni TaxID=568784 RepID=UPI00197BCAD9|nr:DUF31 family protein [Mycoplasma procyoni]MBN3534864.1 DUF31 family protein [Mycoplasma procyoni]